MGIVSSTHLSPPINSLDYSVSSTEHRTCLIFHSSLANELLTLDPSLETLEAHHPLIIPSIRCPRLNCASISPLVASRLSILLPDPESRPTIPTVSLQVNSVSTCVSRLLPSPCLIRQVVV